MTGWAWRDGFRIRTGEHRDGSSRGIHRRGLPLRARLAGTLGSHPAEAGFSKVLAHPDHDERLRQVAEYNAGEVPFADVPALVNQIRSTNQRPRQIDGKLLAMSRTALGGRDLYSTQKQAVRAAFLDALTKHLGE